MLYFCGNLAEEEKNPDSLFFLKGKNQSEEGNREQFSVLEIKRKSLCFLWFLEHEYVQKSRSKTKTISASVKIEEHNKLILNNSQIESSPRPPPNFSVF
nr:hypothetical protein ['Planchonia careya' phytoplasma]